MSKLHVSVYRYQAYDNNTKPLACPQEPSLADWSIEFGHDVVCSEKFPEYSHFVMLIADEACLLSFGQDPGKPSKPVFAGERLFFGVYPGHKLAVTTYA